jgi:CxxC motif-containing protein (DUF1111 family)
MKPLPLALCLLPLLAIAAETDGDPADQQRYRQPLPGLDVASRAQFDEGAKGFDQRWAVAPSILGLWGRGPTSNGEACTDCHENGGRGRPTDDPAAEVRSMLVRLSIPGDGPHNAPRPDPAYGDQLQEEGILGRVPAEGSAHVEWIESTQTLADGEVVPLRRPRLVIGNLAFGSLPSNVMTSIRVAPPLVAVGLIDAIADSDILAQERRQAELALHGHANRVWDVVHEREAIGRFGRKANQPHLLQQVVSAYHADLGVTSRWFPEENCPQPQSACRAEPPGGRPELPPAFLDPVMTYLRLLAPPSHHHDDDALMRRGEQLFHDVGCAHCHVPRWRTASDAHPAALAGREIAPYTDLLVHDLGEALADGRPDFGAGAREWRTAPLWGLGTSASVNGNRELLHDGRARDVTEAILWHGGEALHSRESFSRLGREARSALIAFLQSL